MSDQGEDMLSATFIIALGAVLILSIQVGSMYSAMTSLVGMVVMTLPWALHRRGVFHLPWAVTFAAGSVLFLHSLGIVFRFYDMVWWWDTMTHMMATVIIAMLAALALASANNMIRDFAVPLRLVPVLIVASVILFGVIWEVLEFICDGGLGLNMQYSLDDTATDLTFDILGGGLVALASVPLVGAIEKASREMFRKPSVPSPADR